MSSTIKSALSKRIVGLSSLETPLASVLKSASSYLGQSTYRQIPLSGRYPSPDVPDVKYDPVQSIVTTLPNGIRVASRNTQDPICNIGVYVSAGSRYCSPETSGVGHFLEALSTEGTNNITADRFQENLARTGSGLNVQAFRDAMLYQVETFRKNADFGLESIAELIYNAPIKHWKLTQLQKEYLWRRGDVMKDPESEIPEYMHQAAYQGNTIGLPLFCDHNTIKKITCEVIEEYIKIFYQPSRLIIAGVGINHEELEKLATNTFGYLTNDKEYSNLDFEHAKYTGGQYKCKYDFHDNSNVHIGLIFETESWKSKDLMALCTLNMIMGGGGSFSAGGPGKGMYTRLYRDVLGSHHWINHISCSHSIFDDSGIFCLYGSAPVEYGGDLTGVMVKEVLQMIQKPISQQELDRAKIAFSSNICFEFENRHVVFEDLARQTQTFGRHKTPSEWREDIMKVTAQDIIRVAKKLLSSKPTLLAMGSDVSKVPNVDEIEEVIQKST